MLPMGTTSQTWARFHNDGRIVSQVQSDGGLWHQVLNESSTYLETSATAMNVLSIAVRRHDAAGTCAAFFPREPPRHLGCILL